MYRPTQLGITSARKHGKLSTTTMLDKHWPADLALGFTLLVRQTFAFGVIPDLPWWTIQRSFAHDTRVCLASIVVHQRSASLDLRESRHARIGLPQFREVSKLRLLEA